MAKLWVIIYCLDYEGCTSTPDVVSADDPGQVVDFIINMGGLTLTRDDFIVSDTTVAVSPYVPPSRKGFVDQIEANVYEVIDLTHEHQNDQPTA